MEVTIRFLRKNINRVKKVKEKIIKKIMKPVGLIVMLLIHSTYQMFLKEPSLTDNVEADFEKHYYEGLGLKVTRKSYSKMLQMFNPSHSEETEIARVVQVPTLNTYRNNLRKDPIQKVMNSNNTKKAKNLTKYFNNKVSFSNI